jgi:hypothetical protein
MGRIKGRTYGTDTSRMQANNGKPAIVSETITSFEIYMTDSLRAQYNEAMAETIVMEPAPQQPAANVGPSSPKEKAPLVKKKMTKTMTENEKDQAITLFEAKKSSLNNLLVRQFLQVDRQQQNNIVSKSPT